VRRLLASLAAVVAWCALPAPQAGAATVALGQAGGPSVAIAADPVGLSIEYPVLAADFGSTPCPPPAMVSAIEALGVPTIRIGGDSQDETAPYGTPSFPGMTDLPQAFWSQLACLESQTHEPIVVGLNLASETPAWAATMATGARSAVPAALLSFELGNEADIDGPAVPWWNATDQAKSLIPFQTYLDTAEAVAGQLGAGADIEGPDFATGRWISEVPELVSDLALHTVDTHFYPLNACTGYADATQQALLGEGASSLSSAVLATQAEAERVHLPMIISESNSVACRGKVGVSDSPAAAVWGLRLVVNAIRAGIGSVRFHSSGSSYDPFIVSGSSVTVRPLYYGLEAAVKLLPVGATVTTLKTPSTLAAVRVANSDGSQTYIVTSFAKSSRTVTIPASGTVDELRVIDAEPVLKSSTAKATAGRIKVAIPPDCVVAVTSGA
jgi:hypothetical protein